MMKKIISLWCLLLLGTVSYSPEVNGKPATNNTSIVPVIMALLLDDEPAPSPPLPGANKASLVGPLANASVNYSQVGANKRLGFISPELTSKIEGDLALSGLFSADVLVDVGALDTDLFLVEVNAGQDLDNNGDGLFDPTPTINSGTVRVIATASDLADGLVSVSPLSEISVMYAEQYLNLLDADIEQRLQDVAQIFFNQDITGDGQVDFSDISRFDPSNTAHISALSFNYTDWLGDTASGASVYSAIENGDENAQIGSVDALFGHALEFTTDVTSLPDRFKSIFVTATIFGRGEVENSDIGLNLNSESGVITAESRSKTVALTRQADEQINFTAAAPAGSRIVGWNGCDEISIDLSQCTISLERSRTVTVNIVKDDVVTVSGVNLIDVSAARVIVSATQLSVFTNSSLGTLNQQLDAAVVGDYIVGDEGKGFLREIVALDKPLDHEYEIQTVEASLTDVIVSGTGYISKQLANGDLEEPQIAPQVSNKLGVQTKARIVKRPELDTTFSIVLGEEKNAEVGDAEFKLSSSVDETITLFDNGLAQLTAQGRLDIELDFEFGVDFESRKVSQFRFVTIASSTQTLNIEAAGRIELLDPDARYPITTLSFKPILFSIGFVPVWVTPEVDIYVTASGEIEANVTYTAQATQSLQAGVEYLRASDSGGVFSPIRSSDIGFSSSFDRADVSGFVHPVVHADATIELYGVTGPAIDIALGAKLEGSLELSDTLNQGCTPGFEVGLLATLHGDFYWSLSGDSKLGQILGLEDVEDATRFELFRFNRDIGRWVSGSTCPQDVPYMNVGAFPLHFTKVLGEGGNGASRVISIEYPDQQAAETVNWRMSSETGLVHFGVFEESSEITGQLERGNMIFRDFFIGNLNDLEPGIYRDTITVENLNGDDPLLALSDAELGNTEVDIRVEVVAPDIAVPTIISATSEAPGKVSLSWVIDTTSQFHSYTGFEIIKTYEADDSNDFEQVASINNISTNTITLNEEPGSEISYAIRAYTALGVGSYSDTFNVTVQGEPLPQPIGSGLVAHYKFDGDAQDSSGNGSHGVEYNGLTYIDSIDGQSASFDGVDDYVQIPEDIVQGNEFTISLWMKPLKNDAGVLSGATSQNPNDLLFYIQGNGNIALYYHSSSPTEPGEVFLNQGLIRDGKTHLYTQVVKASHSYLYIDGSLINTIEHDSLSDFNLESLFIGADADCVLGCFESHQYYKGLIDDLRIYNRAIESDEVRALYLQNSIYFEDFSNDPNFTSLSLTNQAYWDQSSENYYVRTRDDLEDKYWAYSPDLGTVDSSKPLRIEFDLLFENQNWGTYPGVRFYANKPTEYNAADNRVLFSIDNAYRNSFVRQIGIYDASGNGYYSPQISNNVWHNISIAYDGNNKADIQVRNLSSNTLIYEITAVDFSIDDFRYFSVGYYNQPDYGNSWSPIRVDNFNISGSEKQEPAFVSLLEKLPYSLDGIQYTGRTLYFDAIGRWVAWDWPNSVDFSITASSDHDPGLNVVTGGACGSLPGFCLGMGGVGRSRKFENNRWVPHVGIGIFDHRQTLEDLTYSSTSDLYIWPSSEDTNSYSVRPGYGITSVSARQRIISKKNSDLFSDNIFAP